MRIIAFLSLILFYVNNYSQSLQIEVDWVGDEQYNVGKKSFNIPLSKNFKNNYSYGDYYSIVRQWENDKLIDKSSVIISNIKYSEIDIDRFNGLEKNKFNNQFNINFNSSVSKNKIFSYLELEPIIFDDGIYKRVESFEVNYRFSEIGKNKKTVIQSSVMRNGDWYQFYVHESGIHKIDRNFLENLGINVQSINPKKIRIFGNGGKMLTMLNSENYITDPVENSIKIIGEEDGSFDSDDYILFYASGPKGYSSENNTNLNLFPLKN